MLLGFAALNVDQHRVRVRQRAGRHAAHLGQAHAGRALDAAVAVRRDGRLRARDVQAPAREPGSDRRDERAGAVEHRRACAWCARSRSRKKRARRFALTQRRLPGQEPVARAPARPDVPGHAVDHRDRHGDRAVVRRPPDADRRDDRRRLPGVLARAVAPDLAADLARLPDVADPARARRVRAPGRGVRGRARHRRRRRCRRRLSPPGKLSVRGLSFAHGAHQVLRRRELRGRARHAGRDRGQAPAAASRRWPRSCRACSRRRAARVFLDGQDVCDLPLPSVRSAIGYAQQSAFLFSTTVGRNIALLPGRPGRGRGDAAGATGARATRRSPTSSRRCPTATTRSSASAACSSRAARSSASRWRARSCAEPRVLVLDDPLSAVDARTERAILDVLERQRARRSVLLITHRVAAARALRRDPGARPRPRRRARHARRADREQGGLYAAFADEQRIESELEALGSDGRRRPAAVPA